MKINFSLPKTYQSVNINLNSFFHKSGAQPIGISLCCWQKDAGLAHYYASLPSTHYRFLSLLYKSPFHARWLVGDSLSVLKELLLLMWLYKWAYQFFEISKTAACVLKSADLQAAERIREIERPDAGWENAAHGEKNNNKFKSLLSLRRRYQAATYGALTKGEQIFPQLFTFVYH